MTVNDGYEDPLVGAVIGDRFRLDRLLGEGGMGRVYIAEQLSMERSVAVKLLHSEIVSSQATRKRFFREAKLLSSLTHPNIVRVIEFGRDAQRNILFLAMELVEGIPVSHLAGRGPLDPSFALEVVYQVCGALVEAHAKGIVHRDLKPENLLLVGIADETLQVKVLDFGVAFPQHESMKLTKSGAICGTPTHMAPEQAESGRVTPRSDLYALGVILYEMLCGDLPFAGDTPLSVMIQHVQKEHPPIRSRLDNLGPVEEDLCQLVDQLLAKDPEDRPQSALATRRRIDEIRNEHGLKTPRISYVDGTVNFRSFLTNDEGVALVDSDSSASPFEATALGMPELSEADTIHDDPPAVFGTETHRGDSRDDQPAGAVQPPLRRAHFGIAAAATVLLVGGLAFILGFPDGDTRESTTAAQPEDNAEISDEVSSAAPASDEESITSLEEKPLSPQRVRLGLLYIESDEEADDLVDSLQRELTFGMGTQPHIEWLDPNGMLDLIAEEGIDDHTDYETLDANACSVGRRGELDHVFVGELDYHDDQWRLRSRMTSTATRAVTGAFDTYGESAEELSEQLVDEIAAWAEEI